MFYCKIIIKFMLYLFYKDYFIPVSPVCEGDFEEI